MKKYYIYEMDMNVLNVVAIIIFVVMFIITVFMPNFEMENANLFLTFLLMIPYFSLHEILHGIGYRLHGAKWENITFGANLEKGVLCCLCKQNVGRKCILISLIYPLFFIGIVTYIIGLIIKSPVLVLLSIMNISGAAGDIIMFVNFLKLKGFQYSEYDDPTSFGLYSKKDLSNLKMFGLKYKGEAEELKRRKLKKLQISKISIVIFIIMILASFLFL